MPYGPPSLCAVKLSMSSPLPREVDFDVSNRLDRITVRNRAVLGCSRGDLAHRLQRADLVVPPHHRNQRGFGIDRLAESREISPTSRI